MEIENRSLIVFEALEAVPIRKMVCGAISLEEKLNLAIELAKGMRNIHSEGVIHKNITSANLWWSESQKCVKWTDFSSATIYEQSNAFEIDPSILEGDVRYMSPEQTGRVHRHVDQRSDLYSLGMVIYELLSGSLPF